MDYSYFLALTRETERLVAALEAQEPGGFHYAGMDMRNVVARRIYVQASTDPALYGLFARAHGLPSQPPAQFQSVLAWKLARHWFGPQADSHAPARLRFQAAAWPLRLWLGRGRSRAPRGAQHDILFSVSSPRFARFLAPIAARFRGRCAFLARESAELNTWLRGENHPLVTLGATGARARFAGRQLARLAPGAALEAEELSRALQMSRPRAVVVAEGNAPEDETLARVGAKLNVPVICVQQGWSPLIHTCFRHMSFAAMMLWGEGFAQILAPANPGQSFIPAGNFHLAPQSQRPRAGVAFFGVGLNGWLGPDDEAELLRLAARLARAMPQVPVIFRPHPRDPIAEELLAPLRGLPNVRFSGSEEPLADLLAEVEVGVSIYSSTILECAASGVVPVIFNPTAMPHYVPDVAMAGAGVEVKSSQAAYDALCSLLTPGATDAFRPALGAFQSRFFARRGEAALDFLCADIIRRMV